MTKVDDLTFIPDHARALAYFRRQPGYIVSPLVEVLLPSGDEVLVKGETARMGLGAFKALGGPYAVFRILTARWREEGRGLATMGQGSDIDSGADFQSFAARQTFVTASAGNHGIGVAAGARAQGANARIYLARTVPDSFKRRLEKHGATVVRSGATYEDSVAAAVADAAQTGATLLADGTWQGYTEIPKIVMEGYTVVAEELRASFEATGKWPSHVFLQAGVGGFAAAMAHMIRANWAVQPELIVVEPEAAACLQASHLAGKSVRADGPSSAMGRLDCKVPSIVALHVLERCGIVYETLSEEEGLAAAETVLRLGIPTTPSGAAGYGGMQKWLQRNTRPADFLPLVVITEGADTNDRIHT